MGKVGPRMVPSSSHSPNSLLTMGLTGGGSVVFLMDQSMLALLHYGKPIASRSFGIECIQPSVDVSGKLCISSSCINSCMLS